MRYLLDTHVVLWYVDEPDKIPQNIRDIIADPTIEKCVSIASAWEFAIKVSTGKMRLLNGDVNEFFSIIKLNGFELLTIKQSHLVILSTLPPIHRDPFDRLIVATAVSEQLTVITSDDNIKLYDIAYA